MPSDPFDVITNQPQRRTFSILSSKMLKPLPSTLRERSRYIVLELNGEGSYSKKEMSAVLWNTTLQFLGELGASKLNLWVIDWDRKKNRGIVKVTSSSLDDMVASIALIKDVNGKRVIPQVLKVSGTLKKAREYL